MCCIISSFSPHSLRFLQHVLGARYSSFSCGGRLRSTEDSTGHCVSAGGGRLRSTAMVDTEDSMGQCVSALLGQLLEFWFLVLSNWLL
jgi:hypothetical protein